MDDEFQLSNKPPRPAPWRPSNEPARQKVLLAGLDCLPEQQDLFETDGQPEADHA